MQFCGHTVPTQPGHLCSDVDREHRADPYDWHEIDTMAETLYDGPVSTVLDAPDAEMREFFNPRRP